MVILLTANWNKTVVWKEGEIILYILLIYCFLLMLTHSFFDYMRHGKIFHLFGVIIVLTFSHIARIFSFLNLASCIAEYNNRKCSLCRRVSLEC